MADRCDEEFEKWHGEPHIDRGEDVTAQCLSSFRAGFERRGQIDAEIAGTTTEERQASHLIADAIRALAESKEKE